MASKIPLNRAVILAPVAMVINGFEFTGGGVIRGEVLTCDGVLTGDEVRV